MREDLFSQFVDLGEIRMNFCAQFGRGKGRKKQFKSCGDLTIYPIREIKGNRVIYGDQYDSLESECENHYFVKNPEFHPEMLAPDSDSENESSDSILTDEPVYAEIARRPTLKLSRSFEYIPISQSTNQNSRRQNSRLKDLLFSSHPSLQSYHSQSTDSGYRSVVVHHVAQPRYANCMFALDVSGMAWLELN